MLGWFGTGSGCRGDCQGIAQERVGACAVISGAILSPAVISGPAIGCVNSFTFVGSGSGSGGGGSLVLVLVVVVVVVVDATICIADMHRRYAPPICKAGKQKRPRAYCSWPLMLFAFVIRYFTFEV